MRSALPALFVFITLCAPFFSWAQKVSTVNATRQDWSGGIAGRYGSYYTFIIEFSDCKEEPAPDTLWIGQEPFKLSLYNDTALVPGNTKRTRNKRSVRFEINTNTSHDTPEHNPLPKSERSHLHALLPYKGVALLSYHYKGKEHFYEIRKILKVLPPANYP